MKSSGRAATSCARKSRADSDVVDQSPDRQVLAVARAIRSCTRNVREPGRGSRAAVRLVLAQPSIGSQLVDNLNASSHVRAVLTDLFLLDEALKR